MVEEEKPRVRVVNEEEPETLRNGRVVTGDYGGPGKVVVAGNEGQQAGEKTVEAEDKAETGGKEVVRSQPKSRYLSLCDWWE